MKEVVAEAINALNRDKRRVKTTDEGFTSTATDFAQIDKTIGINHFPACYRKPANSTVAIRGYAARQLPLAVATYLLVHMDDDGGWRSTSSNNEWSPAIPKL